jgi:hypothetical protein
MKPTPHFDRLASDIFRALGNPIAAAVEIGYSGSGDSGWFDGGYAIRFNGGFISDCELKSGSPSHILGENSVLSVLDEAQIAALQAIDSAINREALHNELGQILEDSAPGWENDAGGSGCFQIDSNGKRTHTHNQYFESCETTREAF